MTSPEPDPCELVTICPVCGGRMDLVYDRPKAKVCVCVDCHTGVTVPAGAWEIARKRRAAATPESGRQP